MTSPSLAAWRKNVDHHGAQDFLVRGLIGFDQSTGAMAIGDDVHVGQRMRFMVRDREGAMQDLTDHALAFKRRQLQVRFHASIAFSSNWYHAPGSLWELLLIQLQAGRPQNHPRRCI